MTISITPTSKVSKLADIEDSIRGTKFVLGENSVVDSFVKVKSAGGTGDIIIGNMVYINSGCILYSGNGITIGNNVAIAANCVLAPVNHLFSQKSIPIMEQGFAVSKGGIIIEDDVWIGAGCVILDGARIRSGAVVGAMSLVRGEIAPHSIVGGNPLRKLGKRK